MAQLPEEWLKQADYDMDTADYMFEGGRYFYAVFMCHLAIEKALKGFYRKKLRQEPPRVHNLIYLLNKIGIMPPEPVGRFIVKLNEASVATRYPEEIGKLQKDFTKGVVKDILSKGRETLEWIKKQL
ncbi:MAG: DNA-binding protein [Deltaproteobacteria bacterium GWA2_57_13]|nr:MAG: DNA-binding protein [Deltaproteobacteria bacterium GWA2_57_13]